MSGISSDNDWQIAPNRKSKSEAKPAAEAESSAPQSQASAVEHAATSLDPTVLDSAVSQPTNDQSQQTNLPVLVASAKQSQALHLTAPERTLPEKSEKSSESLSPDKGYLTARESPGNGGSSGTEEAYLSAEESVGETIPVLAEPSPLLRSPDFHTQFLSFPSPGLESQSEGEAPSGDIPSKVGKNPSENIIVGVCA